MRTALNQIVEGLSAIRSLADLGDIIDEIRDAFDVDHINYYALSLGVDAHSAPQMNAGAIGDSVGMWLREGRSMAALTYSPDWIARYNEGRFELSDPVMISAGAAFAPVDWADVDWSRTGARRFFQEASDFGVGNQGYSIPVRGPGGQYAVFTVNKSCPKSTWESLLAEHRTDLLVLAHFVHQQALRIAGAEDTAPARPLSAREADTLRLLAQGLNRARAAERLGISENTLRVYIDSARHKLGAANIPHAIALATCRNLIAF